MTHPSSLDLEAFAVGEPLPPHLAGHVDECTACGAFLAQLRTVVSSGPSTKDADDAVARALARAEALELHPWAGEVRDRYVRIHAAEVTGRRITESA